MKLTLENGNTIETIEPKESMRSRREDYIKKVKICDFEKAVKICEAYRGDPEYDQWEYRTGRAYGIPESWGKWGTVTDAYFNGWVYIVDDYEVPIEFVTHNYESVLRYGDIITDDIVESGSYLNKTHKDIRVRIIAYEGNIYYHKMVNGVVVEFKKIGVYE